MLLKASCCWQWCRVFKIILIVKDTQLKVTQRTQVDTKFSFQVCKRLKQSFFFQVRWGLDGLAPTCTWTKILLFCKSKRWWSLEGSTKKQTKKKTCTIFFGFQNQNSKNCVILCLCQLTVATPISYNHDFINVLKINYSRQWGSLSASVKIILHFCLYSLIVIISVYCDLFHQCGNIWIKLWQVT